MRDSLRLVVILEYDHDHAEQLAGSLIQLEAGVARFIYERKHGDAFDSIGSKILTYPTSDSPSSTS